MKAIPSTQTIQDDFWIHDAHLFQGNFRYYRNKPQPVRGKIHLSEERYHLEAYEREVEPLDTLSGTRTYVMMHPYVFEPNIILTVGLYQQSKQYADQDEAIGETVSSRADGVREVQIGNAQAWYYPADKTIVLWECYLWDFVRDNPLLTDANMKHIWCGFETFLKEQFPQATRIVTPFNDPVAKSIEEYQTFLRSLGYEPVAKAAFGKTL